MKERLVDVLRRYNVHNAYSPICGDVFIKELTGDAIIVESTKDALYADTSTEYKFDADGRYCDHGEVLLFPSKNNWNWNTVKKVTISSVVKKMKEYDFSDAEIALIENQRAPLLKGLDYYLDKNGIHYGDIVDNIIDYIEFDKIEMAMQALDWGWFDNKKPTESDLKRKLLDLLNELYEYRDRDEYRISTGGFTVGFRVFEPDPGEEDSFENCVRIYVYFAVDEYDSMM